MQTISGIVEDLIRNKTYLEDAMADNLINLSSLARQIKPEVELRIGREVKMGAIVMALKRYTSYIDLTLKHKFMEIIRSLGDITVRSDLADYTYQNSVSLMSNHLKLLELIGSRKEVFYTFSQGVYETTFVLSNIVSKDMENIFESENLISMTEELSSITVNLPSGNNKLPGLYYYFFKNLAWNGINIIEVISTTNEFTIVVEDEDINRAFSILKQIKVSKG